MTEPTFNSTPLWVECGADLPGNSKFPFTRKHYLFLENTWQFRNAYNNQGVYQTALSYINPVWYLNDKGKWLIQAEESIKWGDFYLDFDTKIETESDYRKIKEDIQMALRYLQVILQIPIHQVRFFFSGNKGIHLTVSPITLGLTPHVALNKIYKNLAEDIAQYCTHQTLDTVVYDNKRMFRMVNSWNIKGGAYKIPITKEEYDTLTHNQLRALAQQPREVVVSPPMESPRTKAMLQNQIQEWSKRVEQRKTFQGKMLKLKEDPPCIQAMWEKVFRETIDGRNNSATALASFYLQQGNSQEECLEKVLQWNAEQCSPPQPDGDIVRAVRSVYQMQYKYGCETFKKVSGVCQRDICPLFRPGGVSADTQTEKKNQPNSTN